jgi:hypothetical protein
MITEFKRAVSGASGPGTVGVDAAARAEADSILDEGGKDVASEIDALGRAGARSAREADAERQLAELKRRMGK